MRLLSRVDGVLSFTIFRDPPSSYATLSHTWGEEEVTYQDVLANKLNKAGAKKLDFLLKQAASHNTEYVWIDTCCIDKTDRVELGEAINRMWQWYAQCTRCFVYLVDVDEPSQVRHSKWFTRGWTLQELLAPKYLLFFDAEGRFLGDRVKLRHDIHVACEVDVEVPLNDVPLSERFRWSLSRKTTVEEDASYCLVGLLEVKILFNYGEDAEGARKRLFEEVADEHGKRVVREMQQILAEHAAREKEPKQKPVGMSESDLLHELEFEVECRRWQAISSPYQDTCTWILAHEDYKQWTSGRSRLLWIKGKAGSGKSTIMKFIQSQAGGIHVAFYFNARGDLIEHATIGLYRSILAQLLRRTTVAKQVVAHINQQSKSGIQWALTASMLQATLRHAVGLLREDVQCYIDALDECSKREVQEMLNFFGAISSKHLRICFASRHYPAVTIPNSVEIVLEKQHHADIATLVNGQLAVNDDPLELKRQIIQKANGVFFWAVLVVNLLNDDLSNGNMYQVKQRLLDLPEELEDLLQGIILSNPEDEAYRFRLCLCWLLFSFRPLKAKEFYCAMVAGLSLVNMAPPRACFETMDSMFITELERFISSCSRGLAEVLPDSTVQVVHESVRDFLLRHRGMQMLIHEQDADMNSWAHNQLKEVCFFYGSSVHEYVIPGDRATNKVIEWWRVPLMDYVQKFTVVHAKKAAASISQDDFLRDMEKLEPASMRFFYLANGRAQYAKPSFMACLVSHNASKLIRDATRIGVSNCSDLDMLLPLALSESAIDSYEALLDCGLEMEGDQDKKTALSAYKHKVPQLERKLAQVDARESRINRSTLLSMIMKIDKGRSSTENLLYRAIHAGDVEMVNLLLDSEPDTEHKNIEGEAAFPAAGGKFHTLKRTLSMARWHDNCLLALGVRAGADDYVRILLSRGASVEGKVLGMPLLHHACERRGTRMIGMLLEAGADPDANDHVGCTPLLRIIQQKPDARWVEVTRLLLEYGGDPTVRTPHGHLALDILGCQTVDHSLLEYHKAVIQMLQSNVYAKKMSRIDRARSKLDKSMRPAPRLLARKQNKPEVRSISSHNSEPDDAG